MRSATVSKLTSEFDQFLFAPIGADTGGMRLSVLSALARLNLDPWQEAAKLTQLPNGTAIERLCSLIAALPNGSSSYLDLRTTAARLISYLPRRLSPEVPIAGVLPVNSRAALFMALFMALVLATGWIIGNGRSGPAEDTGSPTISTPNSDQ